MFANSALAKENYRKNETPMRFLRAKTSPAFRFFVGLTIIAFGFVTIVPRSLLAQESATSTEAMPEEMTNGQFPISDESPITNDQTNATSTDELVNDGLPIINDDLPDAATTTEDVIDADDQLSLINDDSSDDPNDQLSMINDLSDGAAIGTATTTEDVIDPNDQLSMINDDSSDDPNDQLSMINDLSDGAATSTAAADSLIEIEFTNVYYGQVGENQETIAPQITSAIIRNIGQVPAAVMIWQDDMGLGRGQGGEWNIQYGARAAGGEWIFYDPFEMVLLPDVLLPGQSAQMEFSVRVFDFPKTGAGAEIDYQGIMTINGVAAPQGEQSLPFLNEILSGDVADSDLKPESEIE